MPELPDITAYLTALTPRVVGQLLEHVRISSPLLLRTARPPITAAEGLTVKELRRIGKRIIVCFDAPAASSGTTTPGPAPSPSSTGPLFLVLHLMIAGRLHWRAPGAAISGRNNLAAFDFPTGSLVLTEAGTKRRASLHLVQGEQALADLDPGGLDPFSLDLAAFQQALTQPLGGQRSRTLKRALTDPRLLSGIGNAYSDEILHAAQLSPIVGTGKLSSEQWQRLYDSTLATLQLWIDRFNAEATRTFPEKVTAFRPEMAVHGRFNQPCRRCGSPVQRIRFADNETNYCPTCQTGGKLLADRSLSRLLGADWPHTLDELEALKRK